MTAISIRVRCVAASMLLTATSVYAKNKYPSAGVTVKPNGDVEDDLDDEAGDSDTRMANGLLAALSNEKRSSR